MARADLSSLLGKLDTELPPTRPTTIEPSAPGRAPAVTDPPAAARRRSVSKLPLDQAVGYLGFVRKDTRLREDQLEALTVHARRLNRAKRNTGIRITENTLIRVAIDLLLTRMEQAAGDDEATLLESLR